MAIPARPSMPSGAPVNEGAPAAGAAFPQGHATPAGEVDRGPIDRRAFVRSALGGSLGLAAALAWPARLMAGPESPPVTLLSRGLRVSEKLDFGMIGLNRGLVSDPAAPFGGTKQSGLGREGAQEGMKEFLETQYVSVTW